MSSPAPPPPEPADVFLSHNSDDKPGVHVLAEGLRARGLKVWLDERELPPGGSFVSRIGEALETCGAIAVVLGPAGWSDFHRREAEIAIVEAEARKIPVIPVLLPGAPGDARFPALMRASTWIRFNTGLDDEQALKALIWGITGIKPPELAAEAAPPPPPPTIQQNAAMIASALASGNVTYVVGTRTAPMRPDLPPYAFEITRHLASEMQWVEPAFTGPFLPTLDTAASYYAIKNTTRGLEDCVATFVQGRLRAIPPIQQGLAELLTRVRNRKSQPRRADPRQLVVTTSLDVAMERALLHAGVAFTRIVQFSSGERLAVNEYRRVEKPDDATLLVSGPTGEARRVALASTEELDAAIREVGSGEVSLEDPRPAGATDNGNALQLLSLRAYTSPILYKYHGSQDVYDSCTISSEQYFDLANTTNIPREVTELIGSTPLLFLGCGMLDSDFRHLRHTLLRRSLKRAGTGARIAVQVPPADEPMDPYRLLEKEMWDHVREHVNEDVGIKVVEGRGEAFLAELLRQLQEKPL